MITVNLHFNSAAIKVNNVPRPTLTTNSYLDFKYLLPLSDELVADTFLILKSNISILHVFTGFLNFFHFFATYQQWP